MAAKWTVSSQTPRTRVDTAGNVQDGYDVTFVTGDGHTGTVFVPMTQYTVDKVRALIQPMADSLDTVGALTSESE